MRELRAQVDADCQQEDPILRSKVSKAIRNPIFSAFMGDLRDLKAERGSLFMVRLVPTLFSEFLGNTFSQPLFQTHSIQAAQCEQDFKEMASSVRLGGQDVYSMFIRFTSGYFADQLKVYFEQAKNNFQRMVTQVSPEVEGICADVIIIFAFLGLIF